MKPDTDLHGPDAALRAAWDRLHRGDRETFPDEAHIAALGAAHPALASADPAAVAGRLRAAWRAYHAGTFTEAVTLGLALGPIGGIVACKAANIQATYIESDEGRRLALWRESAARAESLQGLAPSLPNAFYLHAQALGRTAQLVSVARALADGIAGRVRASLERTLALASEHAEAHIAFGSFHAEIVAKIGVTMARLTYGARRDAALFHYERALTLLPHSAIARIEYANGLVMLYGRNEMARARKLYEEAAACPPQDEMERLDAARAAAELA